MQQPEISIHPLIGRLHNKLVRLERDRDSLVVVPFRKRKGGSAHEHNGSF